MATPNLTSSTPHLSHHLSDPTFTPIITSSSSPAQTQALTSLTGTALTAYDAASRLGLGVPQRISMFYCRFKILLANTNPSDRNNKRPSNPPLLPPPIPPIPSHSPAIPLSLTINHPLNGPRKPPTPQPFIRKRISSRKRERRRGLGFRRRE